MEDVLTKLCTTIHTACVVPSAPLEAGAGGDHGAPHIKPPATTTTTTPPPPPSQQPHSSSSASHSAARGEDALQSILDSPNALFTLGELTHTIPQLGCQLRSRTVPQLRTFLGTPTLMLLVRLLRSTTRYLEHGHSQRAATPCQEDAKRMHTPAVTEDTVLCIAQLHVTLAAWFAELTTVVESEAQLAELGVRPGLLRALVACVRCVERTRGCRSATTTAKSTPSATLAAPEGAPSSSPEVPSGGAYSSATRPPRASGHGDDKTQSEGAGDDAEAAADDADEVPLPADSLPSLESLKMAEADIAMAGDTTSAHHNTPPCYRPHPPAHTSVKTVPLLPAKVLAIIEHAATHALTALDNFIVMPSTNFVKPVTRLCVVPLLTSLLSWRRTVHAQQQLQQGEHRDKKGGAQYQPHVSYNAPEEKLAAEEEAEAEEEDLVPPGTSSNAFLERACLEVLLHILSSSHGDRLVPPSSATATAGAGLGGSAHLDRLQRDLRLWECLASVLHDGVVDLRRRTRVAATRAAVREVSQVQHAPQRSRLPSGSSDSPTAWGETGASSVTMAPSTSASTSSASNSLPQLQGPLGDACHRLLVTFRILLVVADQPAWSAGSLHPTLRALLLQDTVRSVLLYFSTCRDEEKDTTPSLQHAMLTCMEELDGLAMRYLTCLTAAASPAQARMVLAEDDVPLLKALVCCLGKSCTATNVALQRTATLHCDTQWELLCTNSMGVRLLGVVNRLLESAEEGDRLGRGEAPPLSSVPLSCLSSAASSKAAQLRQRVLLDSGVLPLLVQLLTVPGALLQTTPLPPVPPPRPHPAGAPSGAPRSATSHLLASLLVPAVPHAGTTASPFSSASVLTQLPEHPVSPHTNTAASTSAAVDHSQQQQQQYQHLAACMPTFRRYRGMAPGHVEAIRLLKWFLRGVAAGGVAARTTTPEASVGSLFSTGPYGAATADATATPSSSVTSRSAFSAVSMLRSGLDVALQPCLTTLLIRLTNCFLFYTLDFVDITYELSSCATQLPSSLPFASDDSTVYAGHSMQRVRLALDVLHCVVQLFHSGLSLKTEQACWASLRTTSMILRIAELLERTPAQDPRVPSAANLTGAIGFAGDGYGDYSNRFSSLADDSVTSYASCSRSNVSVTSMNSSTSASGGATYDGSDGACFATLLLGALGQLRRLLRGRVFRTSTSRRVQLLHGRGELLRVMGQLFRGELTPAMRLIMERTAPYSWSSELVGGLDSSTFESTAPPTTAAMPMPTLPLCMNAARARVCSELGWLLVEFIRPPVWSLHGVSVLDEDEEDATQEETGRNSNSSGGEDDSEETPEEGEEEGSEPTSDRFVDAEAEEVKDVYNENAHTLLDPLEQTNLWKAVGRFLQQYTAEAADPLRDALMELHDCPPGAAKPAVQPRRGRHVTSQRKSASSTLMMMMMMAGQGGNAPLPSPPSDSIAAGLRLWFMRDTDKQVEQPYQGRGPATTPQRTSSATRVRNSKHGVLYFVAYVCASPWLTSTRLIHLLRHYPHLYTTLTTVVNDYPRFPHADYALAARAVHLLLLRTNGVSMAAAAEASAQTLATPHTPHVTPPCAFSVSTSSSCPPHLLNSCTLWWRYGGTLTSCERWLYSVVSHFSTRSVSSATALRRSVLGALRGRRCLSPSAPTGGSRISTRNSCREGFLAESVEWMSEEGSNPMLGDVVEDSVLQSPVSTLLLTPSVETPLTTPHVLPTTTSSTNGDPFSGFGLRVVDSVIIDTEMGDENKLQQDYKLVGVGPTAPPHQRPLAAWTGCCREVCVTAEGTRLPAVDATAWQGRTATAAGAPHQTMWIALGENERRDEHSMTVLASWPQRCEMNAASMATHYSSLSGSYVSSASVRSRATTTITTITTITTTTTAEVDRSVNTGDSCHNRRRRSSAVSSGVFASPAMARRHAEALNTAQRSWVLQCEIAQLLSLTSLEAFVDSWTKKEAARRATVLTVRKLMRQLRVLDRNQRDAVSLHSPWNAL